MDLLKSIANLLRPLHSLPCRLTDQQGEKLGHIAIGELGEKIASSALKKAGRKVLYKNYRGPRGGEIDIIARHGEILTFVEVKTRRKRNTSRPLDAVNQKKQKLIIRGAKSWLGLLKENDFLWRYDVVEVELIDGKPPEITIVADAFHESP